MYCADLSLYLLSCLSYNFRNWDKIANTLIDLCCLDLTVFNLIRWLLQFVGLYLYCIFWAFYLYAVTCLSIICSVNRLKKKARIRNNKLKQGAAKVAEELRSVSFFFLRPLALVSFKSDGCSNGSVLICSYVDNPHKWFVSKVILMPLMIHTKHSFFVARLVCDSATNHWHIPCSWKLDGN